MNKSDINSVPWWKKGIIYQIYPRSFLDTTGDGIGDIRGIINKLDYLNDGTPNSLGIDALWISPIFPSPMKDFGYDISNYIDIDPIFGSLEDFTVLLEEAHKRGIRIILDLVINHSSDTHPWFIESRSSKDNPKRDWYIWHPGRNGKKPNNWFAAFELKNAWWWDEKTQEYYLATFTKHQPEFNWRNPDFKKEIYNQIKFWLDLGVDGYRMDVVNWYVKDAKWRSNPWKLKLHPPDCQIHLYDRDQPETHQICREIRQITDQYKEKMLVGEIYCDDTKIALDYYGKGDELHLAFNFEFLFQKWKAKSFHNIIEEWDRLMPENCWPNYTLSNHDQPRHYHRYKKGKYTDARARVAAAMILTLKGTPFIYYGEEIGMSNGNIPHKSLQDPVGVKSYPFFKGRDGERTPMQWNASQNAGFSSGIPWLPVNPDYTWKNVEAQKDDKNSLLSFYRKLIWLRKKNPVLCIGEYKSLVKNPDNYLAYMKYLDDEKIIVLLNFSHKDAIAGIDMEKDAGDLKVLFSTHRKENEKLDITSLTLKGYEVLIAKIV